MNKFDSGQINIPDQHTREQLLQAVLDSTGEGILVVDREGHATHVNRHFARMWNIPEELLSTRNDQKLLDFVLSQLSDPQAFLEKVQQLYMTADEDYDTLSFKDGRIFERISYPLLDKQNIRGRVWCFRDITERRKIEELNKVLYKISEAANTASDMSDLLAYIRNKLHTLIDTTNFFVALYKPENDTYFFPYCMDEKDELTHEYWHLKNSLTDYIRRTGKPLLIDEKLHAELEARGEVGVVGTPSAIWMGVPLKTQQGVIGVVVVQSYSNPNLYKEEDLDLMVFVSEHIASAIERKRSEVLIKQSEEKYRVLVETMRDGVAVLDLNDHFIFVNPAACNILGYSQDELLDMDFQQIIISDGRTASSNNLTDNDNCNCDKYELTVIHKNRRPRQLFISSTPYLNDRGEITGAVIVFTDITDIKEHEEEKRELRDKLEIAKRMESLGVLAGGVAHDLNNILGPLVAYPQLLLEHLEPDHPLREYLKKIEMSAKLSANIVQDLLTMARRGRYEMSPVNLNDVIRNYMESTDYNRLVNDSRDVRIELNLNESIPEINGSETHLHKLIMNLAINAVDAMPHGGKLTISTFSEYIEPKSDAVEQRQAGQYTIISVSDSGIGIAQQDLKRIFEPFYSRKQLGRSGSGLGLAVVYGVVKDHNGFIEVRSELDVGTEFIVYLPSIAERREIETREDESNLDGSGKVLVVDDMLEQRELLDALLSDLGYEVHTVASGREAVTYLQNNTADLVILDMIMEPDFDGLDTFKAILKIHPDQKAIIVSGYAETDRVKEAEELGVLNFVKKPYTLQILGLAVKEAITLATRHSLQFNA